MSAPLELARHAYDLLVNKYENGLTREQLAAKLGVKDRKARDAVNLCRTLAAENPKPDGSVWIIGHDPQIERYVAARDVHQARRVIAYQESRVLDINRGLEAQMDRRTHKLVSRFAQKRAECFYLLQGQRLIVTTEEGAAMLAASGGEDASGEGSDE